MMVPIRKDAHPGQDGGRPISHAPSPMGTTVECLSEQVEAWVRRTTQGRIRNLTVREADGRIWIRGLAPSHHVRQLALHGALQVLPGDRLRDEIRVGKWGGGGRPTRAEWIDYVRPRRPLIPRSNRGPRPLRSSP
jgi:hypothetical protein